MHIFLTHSGCVVYLHMQLGIVYIYMEQNSETMALNS